MAAVAVGVTLVVAGCTDGSSPKPSPLPSPSAPAMPAEARGSTPPAVEAFGRHYVAAVNFALRTGDTDHLKELAASTCGGCAAITNRIDEVYGRGGRLEGAGWIVRTANGALGQNGRTAQVSMGLTISKQIAFESPGASPSPSRAIRGLLDLQLRRSGKQWRVERLQASS